MVDYSIYVFFNYIRVITKTYRLGLPKCAVFFTFTHLIAVVICIMLKNNARKIMREKFFPHILLYINKFT